MKIFAMETVSRSRIHECTITLRFLGIILRVPYTMFTLKTSFNPKSVSRDDYE
jgi:hypothetical protein